MLFGCPRLVRLCGLRRHDSEVIQYPRGLITFTIRRRDKGTGTVIIIRLSRRKMKPAFTPRYPAAAVTDYKSEPNKRDEAITN